jgi:hypothetical protein
VRGNCSQNRRIRPGRVREQRLHQLDHSIPRCYSIVAIREPAGKGRPAVEQAVKAYWQAAGTRSDALRRYADRESLER